MATVTGPRQPARRRLDGTAQLRRPGDFANEDVPDFVPQVHSCGDEPAFEQGRGVFGSCSHALCRSSDTRFVTKPLVRGLHGCWENRFLVDPRSRRACIRAGTTHKTGVGVVPPTPVCGLAIEWSRSWSSLDATPRARRVELRQSRGAARPDRPSAASSSEEQRAPASVAETVRPVATGGLGARRTGDRCRPVVVAARLAVDTVRRSIRTPVSIASLVCHASSAHHRVGLSCARELRG